MIELQQHRMEVLDEEPTDPRYGSRPSERSVAAMLEYGLVPLDKPRGPTSHEVVAWTRKLLGVDKAGHSGTLDPPVSGVLPIGLGQSTHALSLLLMFPKEYRGVMRIHSSVTKKQIDWAVAEFTGEIFQRPPQRSSVSRQTRTRVIHEFELTESQGNLFLFRVLCQSGTYIRKLIYDMGEVLGVGATMVELRRTRVGPLSEEILVTLHQLNDAVFRQKAGDEAPLRNLILPIEGSLGSIGRIVIRDSAVDAICHGARLGIPGILSISQGVRKDDTVALMSPKGELVAVGKALLPTEEVKRLRRGLASTTERVVMKAGTYPRLWKTQAGKRKFQETKVPSAP